MTTHLKIYPEQWNQILQKAYISPILSPIDNHNNSIVNEKIDEIKDRFNRFKLYLCNIEKPEDSEVFKLIFSDLEVVALNMASEAVGIDSEPLLFAKLQEYRVEIPSFVTIVTTPALHKAGVIIGVRNLQKPCCRIFMGVIRFTPGSVYHLAERAGLKFGKRPKTPNLANLTAQKILLTVEFFI